MFKTAPGGNADHGVEGISLETDLIIEHQLGGHIGRAQKDNAKIVFGVGGRMVSVEPRR